MHEIFCSVKISEDWDDFVIEFKNPWMIPEEIKDRLFKDKYLKSKKLRWNWIWAYFASLITRAHFWSISIIYSDEEKWTCIALRLPKNILQIPEFKLVYIDTSLKNRYTRISNRRENADDIWKTMEQFIKEQELETEVQIRWLKDIADIVIDNNWSFEEFYKQIDNLIK